MGVVRHDTGLEVFTPLTLLGCLCEGRDVRRRRFGLFGLLGAPMAILLLLPVVVLVVFVVGARPTVAHGVVRHLVVLQELVIVGRGPVDLDAVSICVRQVVAEDCGVRVIVLLVHMVVRALVCVRVTVVVVVVAIVVVAVVAVTVVVVVVVAVVVVVVMGSVVLVAAIFIWPAASLLVVVDGLVVDVLIEPLVVLLMVLLESSKFLGPQRLIGIVLTGLVVMLVVIVVTLSPRTAAMLTGLAGTLLEEGIHVFRHGVPRRRADPLEVLLDSAFQVEVLLGTSRGGD